MANTFYLTKISTKQNMGNEFYAIGCKSTDAAGFLTGPAGPGIGRAATRNGWSVSRFLFPASL